MRCCAQFARPQQDGIDFGISQVVDAKEMTRHDVASKARELDEVGQLMVVVF
mgnify:CR=1 FL=1